MEPLRIPLPNLEGASMTVHGKHGDMVLSASAYDVPRLLEVRFEPSSRLLTISFEYLAPEESKPTKLDDDFQVMTGIHSGKLLSIQISNFGQRPGEISVKLAGLLERQARSAPKVNQKLNFETVKSVVESRRDQIFAVQ